MAWELYAADSPAVVELLLVAHNPAVSALKRYQAEMALEWFDPSVDLPRRPSDQEESEPVRLLRLALLSGDMPVRIAAGRELARMLAPSSVWAIARDGR